MFYDAKLAVYVRRIEIKYKSNFNIVVKILLKYILFNLGLKRL